ncbi:hypothetical protein FACS189450_10200 [Spirochaetia bacterium]|nr:hypothetical protein FACS189450_10200 [Spirochaetia bacterium]
MIREQESAEIALTNAAKNNPYLNDTSVQKMNLPALKGGVSEDFPLKYQNNSNCFFIICLYSFSVP